MIEPITLSNATRSFLTARTDLTAVRNDAASRLSTGLKVASITDDARSFLQAQSLLQRVGTLRESKADIAQGISALRATQAGTQAIESLTDQLQSIATAAQSADADEKARLAVQFDEIRSQIDSIAADTTYQGTALIDNPASDLDVNLSDRTGVTLTVEGQASDSTSLGIGNAASYNGFATSTDIDNALAAIDAARTTVRATESAQVSNTSFLNTREAFNEQLSNTLQSGADKLTLTDINLDGATLLAANVRDSLAISSQRITAQSERLIGDLIRGA